MTFPKHHQTERDSPVRSQSLSGSEARTPGPCPETRAEGPEQWLSKDRLTSRSAVLDGVAHAAPGVERAGELSRRRLLKYGSAATATLLVPAWLNSDALAGSRKRKLVWGLRPCGSSCATCKACKAHAANKLFRSAKAADRHRAHKHCRCTVVKVGTVTRARWTALFVRPNGIGRPSVDRRWRWVTWLLNPRARTRLDPIAPRS